MTQSRGTTPEISLEVIGGPEDGLFYCGSKLEAYVGNEKTATNQKPNDLALRDTYCSKTHSMVIFKDGDWYLSDRGSKNHTIISGQHLKADSPPVKLEAQDYFVVGSRAVEFRKTARPRPPLPKGKMAPLAPALSTMLNRANQEALKAKKNYVGVEHLFEALADSNAPFISEFFAAAKLNPVEVARQALEYDPWTGPLIWIERAIASFMAGAPYLAPGGDLVQTPRLEYVLKLAEDARIQTGAPGLEAIHLLTAILEEGGGAPNRVFREMGQDSGQLALMAIRLTRAHYGQTMTGPAGTQLAAPSLADRAAPEKAPPAATRRPVDHKTWVAACELLERLQKLQARFQLADARTRLNSLQTEIREYLSKLAPPTRMDVCAELGHLLPIYRDALPLHVPEAGQTEATAASPAVVEGAAKDDRQEGGASLPSAAEGKLQGLFLAIDRSETPTPPGLAANTDVLKLAEFLYRFALRNEEFVLGLLATLQGGKSGESVFLFEGWTQGMGMMARGLLQGEKRSTIEDIQRYLDDLLYWQTALIAAYQESFNRYSETVWERFAPKAIEQKTKGSFGAKLLGTDKSQCWDIFAENSQDISPDSARDEYRRLLRKMTEEKFRNIHRRRDNATKEKEK